MFVLLFTVQFIYKLYLIFIINHNLIYNTFSPYHLQTALMHNEILYNSMPQYIMILLFYSINNMMATYISYK